MALARSTRARLDTCTRAAARRPKPVIRKGTPYAEETRDRRWPLVLRRRCSLAQKVSYDYEKSANFAGFKTYALKDGTKVGQPLIDDRIVAAIEPELAAKGFTKADANPDVFVVYHMAFDKQKDISTYSSGYGGGYGAVRLGLGRRLGRRHDDDAGARHPRSARW